MRYVAIDVETTGLGERCGLLELAMVAEDTTQTVPVEDLPFLRALFWPEGAVWEPFAMKMHRANGLLDEILANFGSEYALDNAVAWGDAEKWLRANTSGKIAPAGKNFAGFDRRFLGPIAGLFDYRALDPGSVFADFSKDRLPGLADLLPQDRASHRALDDARDVVRVLRRAYA